MTAIESLEPPPSSASPRVHLDYLDGLRALAALYVVMHHIWQSIVIGPDAGTLPHWFRVFSVFKFGSYAVGVFIVLSGYCLMLPVVRTASDTFRNGTLDFFRRRARRILPPYYAALVLFTVALFLLPSMQQSDHTLWSLIALPAFGWSNLLSHVFLVHNVSQAWQWKIDPPLWSVALEWQIYFVFALLLLPIWRKLGAAATLAVAFVIGLLPAFLGFGFMYTWYLGLFALGMMAAAINFSPRFQTMTTLQNLPWGKLSGGFWILLLGLLGVLFVSKSENVLFSALVDVILGVATMTFLVACTQALQKTQKMPYMGYLMGLPIPVAMGHFSYSLYLVHYPIVAFLYLQLLRLHIGPTVSFVALMIVGLPIVLAISYGFHRIFERPFMRI